MSYAGPVSLASRRPLARTMAARFSGVLTRANQFKRDIAHVNKLTLGQSYYRSPPDIIFPGISASWGQRRWHSSSGTGITSSRLTLLWTSSELTETGRPPRWPARPGRRPRSWGWGPCPRPQRAARPDTRHTGARRCGQPSPGDRSLWWRRCSRQRNTSTQMKDQVWAGQLSISLWCEIKKCMSNYLTILESFAWPSSKSRSGFKIGELNGRSKRQLDWTS